MASLSPRDTQAGREPERGAPKESAAAFHFLLFAFSFQPSDLRPPLPSSLFPGQLLSNCFSGFFASCAFATTACTFRSLRLRSHCLSSAYPSLCKTCAINHGSRIACLRPLLGRRGSAATNKCLALSDELYGNANNGLSSISQSGCSVLSPHFCSLLWPPLPTPSSQLPCPPQLSTMI